MTIAIVHERWTEIGGSEKVVAELADAWPDAQVYVPFADPASVPPALAGRLHTTRLDALHARIGRDRHAPLLPLVPAALRRLDFGAVDAVVISHHALAVAATAAAGDIPTVAYVHSPARWAWEPAMRAGEASSVPAKVALAALARQTVRVESQAAQQLSAVVANSTEVADRIRRWWGRDATVVYPPVDTDRYSVDTSVPTEDFFLLAGRLVPYKRPDLAIRAAERAGVRLIVAGSGRSQRLCEEVAGPHTTFVGRVSDEELLRLLRSAQALLMPGVEDFGIVPVEAMAAGTPVIARGLGGARDTVIPEVSGVLVAAEPDLDDEQIVAEFARAISAFRAADFDPHRIRAHAEKFSGAAFAAGMRDVITGLR